MKNRWKRSSIWKRSSNKGDNTEIWRTGWILHVPLGV